MSEPPAREGQLPPIYKDTAFISFVQTARAVTKYYDAYLYRRMKLSIVKLAVLTVLELNGGAMTPSEIARETCTERNNITTLVRRMSKEKLVRTEPNAGDKRSVKVVLTDLGRETFQKARVVPMEVRDHVLSSIPRDDLAALKLPLKIMRQNALSGIAQMARGAGKKPRSRRVRVATSRD